MPKALFNVKTDSHAFDAKSRYIGRYSRYVPSNASAPLRAALAAGAGILANEFPLPSVHTQAQRQAVIAQKAAALSSFFRNNTPQSPSALAFFSPPDTKLFCWCDPLPCHGSLILFILERVQQLGITSSSPSWGPLANELQQVAQALRSEPLTVSPAQLPESHHIHSLCDQFRLLSPPQQTLF